jgi:hypothetical protein
MCQAMRDAGAEVIDTNIDYDHVPGHVLWSMRHRDSRTLALISRREL